MRVNPTTDTYSCGMGIRVAANLVIGADGSTTFNGSSRGLSFPADRLRFHQLRAEFHAILIGGNTAKNEPYGKTPLPLIVLSHHPLPALIKANERAVLWDLSLPVAITRAKQEYGDLLVEAGPKLLSAALRLGLLTELFVTISPATPGENQIDLNEFIAGAEEISRESIDDAPGALFLHYRLAPSHD